MVPREARLKNYVLRTKRSPRKARLKQNACIKNENGIPFVRERTVVVQDHHILQPGILELHIPRLERHLKIV